MGEKSKGKDSKKDEIPKPDPKLLGELVAALQKRVHWMQIAVVGGSWEPDPDHGKDGVGRLRIGVRCGRCNVAGIATSAMSLNTPKWEKTFVGPMESETRDWWLDAHHLISDAGKALSGGARRPPQ